MLVRLICLAFLSMFATSVAYAQENDTKSAEELQTPPELTALKVLEAMGMGTESKSKAPDDIDNNDTETDKDSATQTLSATATASGAAAASESPVLESLSDSAASPATKPDPE